MIRTSLQNRKQTITKLVLRRETVRTLGDSELAVVVGGGGTNCTAETYQASGCSGFLLAEAEAPSPK